MANATRKFKQDYSAGNVVNADDLNRISQTAESLGVIYEQCGESITAKDIVYKKTSDGKWYKAQADTAGKIDFFSLGVALDTGSTNDYINIQVSGVATINALTLTVANASTIDQICDHSTTSSNSGGDIFKIDSTTDWFALPFMAGDKVSNLEKVRIYIYKNSTPTKTLEMHLYACDANFKPTGSSLGSGTIGLSSVSSGLNTITFSSPVALDRNTAYCLVFFASGTGDLDGTKNFSFYGLGRSTYTFLGAPSTLYTWSSTNSGSAWSATTDNVQFATYYTEKKYMAGDPVFLSDTAGAVSLTKGTGVNPIGTLISSTQILLGYQGGKYLGKAVAPQRAGNFKIEKGSSCQIPTNCRKILIQHKLYQNSNLDFTCAIFTQQDINIGTKEWCETVVDISSATHEIVYTDINYGCLRIKDSADVGQFQQGNSEFYFYT